MTSSASSPPSSAAAAVAAHQQQQQQQAAAAAAASFPSLGAYPFWFFPPFLPNPYGMNMGINFPSHPPTASSSSGGLSAAAQGKRKYMAR